MAQLPRPVGGDERQPGTTTTPAHRVVYEGTVGSTVRGRWPHRPRHIVYALPERPLLRPPLCSGGRAALQCGLAAVRRDGWPGQLGKRRHQTRSAAISAAARLSEPRGAPQLA